jgi:hypothetical protein
MDDLEICNTAVPVAVTGREVQLVIDAVCRAAEKQTGDPLICSVE